MKRLSKKIGSLLEQVHRIELYSKPNTQAAQIQYVNSIILGLAKYYQPSICSHAYHAIDRRVNNAALVVWKKLFPKQYNQMQVPLKTLCNLPHRHEGYESKTFAIPIEGKWFGITYGQGRKKRFTVEEALAIGPAGSTAAKVLADRGLRVLLAEKCALPRYKSCSGVLIKKSLDLVKLYFGEDAPLSVTCEPAENRGMVFTNDCGREYRFAQEGLNMWRSSFDN